MLSQYFAHAHLGPMDSKPPLAVSAVSSGHSVTVRSDMSVSASKPSPTLTELLPPSYQPAAVSSAEKTSIPRTLQESLDFQDLELMMYWSTTTYRSLTRDQAAEALWQITIPQLSLQFPSLRHGLLALSALQLARDRPACAQNGRTYLVRAREHYRLALAGIQLDSTENLTVVQCNAVFALCAVLLAYIFAHGLILIDPIPGPTATEESQPRTLDEFLQVSNLTRQVMDTMMEVVDRVAEGDLHSLVALDHSRPRMPDISQLLILGLRHRNALEAERNPAHEKDIYDQTLRQLHLSLERLMSGSEPRDFAFCWPCQTPLRFDDLVQQREPFALIVLAHYAVILHHLHNLWWIRDWGTRILHEILDSVDAEWHELMRWPIDATGCVWPER
ncbi:hypothetical protein POX_b03413 [Penicillium oxalicum]|uniref:hypothetical protein n=1 Tax=Penicillium oxalicum TaxID=69781 RepID=UPI0020B7B49F|nr:hypothetical protein POX_b03413 [Penicillium oxalicum]KAI2793359.1 hypothetical protein POX_b03413 [Penicillium oxalicum]